MLWGERRLKNVLRIAKMDPLDVVPKRRGLQRSIHDVKWGVSTSIFVAGAVLDKRRKSDRYAPGSLHRTNFSVGFHHQISSKVVSVVSKIHEGRTVTTYPFFNNFMYFMERKLMQILCEQTTVWQNGEKNRQGMYRTIPHISLTIIFKPRGDLQDQQWDILPYTNNRHSSKYDTSAGFWRDNTVTQGWQSVFIIWITYWTPWSEGKTAIFFLKHVIQSPHTPRGGRDANMI
jgi:hypothetical protein